MLGLSPLEVKNIDGEDAPPFAILEVVRLNVAEGWIEVQKPSDDSLFELLVNSGSTLRAGKLGTAFSPFERPPMLILYDTDETPAAGDDYGTSAGKWYLVKDKTGFVAWDVDDDSLLPTDTWAFQLKVCSSE